jgi:hypothetical protein
VACGRDPCRMRLSAPEGLGARRVSALGLGGAVGARLQGPDDGANGKG